MTPYIQITSMLTSFSGIYFSLSLTVRSANEKGIMKQTLEGGVTKVDRYVFTKK